MVAAEAATYVRHTLGVKCTSEEGWGRVGEAGGGGSVLFFESLTDLHPR